MGATASQASLVISQSSVRGLSFAWRAVALENLAGGLAGAKAPALTSKEATAKEKERNCIFIYILYTLINMDQKNKNQIYENVA